MFFVSKIVHVVKGFLPTRRTIAALTLTLAATVLTPAAHAAWAEASVPRSLYERMDEVAPTFRPDAAQLPNTLVVRPGVYRVGSRSYGLWREGFYELGTRRAVVADARTPVSTIVSGVAWALGFDGNDEQLWGALALPEAITRRVSLTCGYQVDAVRVALAQLGHPARAVALSNRNRGGGSHTLLEVWADGRWTLYDVLYNFQPLVDGHPTTIVEWVRTHGARTGVPLAADDGEHPEAIVGTPGYDSYLGTPLIGDLLTGSWPYSFTDPIGTEYDATYIAGISSGFHYLPPAAFARLYDAP